MLPAADTCRAAERCVCRASRRGGARGVGGREQAPRRIVVDVREFMSNLPAVLHQQGLELVPVTLEVSPAPPPSPRPAPPPSPSLRKLMSVLPARAAQFGCAVQIPSTTHISLLVLYAINLLHLSILCSRMFCHIALAALQFRAPAWKHAGMPAVTDATDLSISCLL